METHVSTPNTQASGPSVAMPGPQPSTEPDILERSDGGVRTITLNRPKTLNSFTVPMMVVLRAALDRAADDASVRCVVLAASGRGFCAGQDLSDPAVAPDFTPGAQAKDIGALVDQQYKPLALRLRNMPVPTVACVQGVAAGAGANIVLGCDVVVAGKAASFVQAFSKIGLVPDAGGTWLLPRQVGRARALGMALLGEKITAEQAERLGLIWRCVDDEVLVSTTQALAQQLAGMPTRALVATRKAMDKAVTMPFEEALSAEAALQTALGQAADYTEGVRAFMEKRAPRFTDR